MARDFATRGDIDTSEPSVYPDGRLRDSNPPASNNGTRVQESLFGDMFQFFLKILRDAGITENGNPDNETNGYQLVQAFEQRITDLGTPDNTISTAKIQDGAVTNPKLGDLSVSTAKMQNNSVTLAKLQDIAQNTFFGRASSGNGDPQVLTSAVARSVLNLVSASYNPTSTNVANVSSTFAFGAQYTRNGDIVTVTGVHAINVIAGNTLTQVQLSLPIASNLQLQNDLSGTVNVQEGNSNIGSGVVDPATANNTMLITFTSFGTGQHRVHFSISYEVQ